MAFRCADGVYVHQFYVKVGQIIVATSVEVGCGVRCSISYPDLARDSQSTGIRYLRRPPFTAVRYSVFTSV